jgi:hypothetical protein
MLGLGGCSPCGCLVKRQSELNCPTDIRQTVPWCAGEDAIFHCPCGPDRNFYGYKPTCWGVWPASSAEWRDSRCGPLVTDGNGEAVEYQPAELPTMVPAPRDQIELSTPPARPVPRAEETDSIIQELPLPDASSSGQLPVERTSGRIWPMTAGYEHDLPPTSQPAVITMTPPPAQEQQLSKPLPRVAVTDRVGAAPMLPGRLVVFQQENLTEAAAHPRKPRESQQQLPKPLPRDAVTDRVGDARMLPERLIVFQQDDEAQALTDLNKPCESPLTWQHAQRQQR